MTITIPDENVVEALVNFKNVLCILYEYSSLKNYDVVCEASVLGTYTKEIEDYYSQNIKPNLTLKEKPEYVGVF